MATATMVYEVTTDKGIEQFTRVSDVAKFTGKKVTKKDVEAGKFEDIRLVEVQEEEDTDMTEQQAFLDEHIEVVVVGDAPKGQLLPPTEEAIEAITKAHEEHKALTNVEEEVEEDTDEVLTNEEDEVEESVEEEVDPADELVEEDTEYPEVGYFEDDKAMKKYIKGLSNDQLQEWCELEGAEWKPNDHEAINRMRMAMAIKALHFPDLAPKGKSKKKSKYADYTTEQLVEMAMDNDVEVRDDKGDPRILRMYTIMALRQAKIID